MDRRTWIEKYGAIAVLVALLVILNPELRAFLLLANYIGLDLMILLFAIQFRLWPLALPALVKRARRPLCVAAVTSLRIAARAVALLLTPARVAVSLTTFVLFLANDLRCPTQRSAI